MSLSNLKKNIEENAEKEAKQIMDEADTKIAEINKKTENEIKAIREETKRFIDEETKRLTDEYISSTDLATRNMIEEARQKVIDNEYNIIKAGLEKELSQSEGYIKIIENSIKEAIKKFGEDGFTITTNRKYKKKIEETFPDIRIMQSDDNEFIIGSNDNKITLNASAGTLIESYSEEIKKGIYKEIFNNKKISKISEKIKPKRGNRNKKNNKNKKG